MCNWLDNPGYTEASGGLQCRNCETSGSYQRTNGKLRIYEEKLNGLASLQAYRLTCFQSKNVQFIISIYKCEITIECLFLYAK